MTKGTVLQSTYVDMVWDENPEYIRKFHENKPKYESLCQEVQYILKQKLQQEDIEVAAVTARAKTQDSFCEKLYRKSYSDPFSEITDYAGARVVYLYSSDRPKIEALIESEFEVIEKADKVSSNEDDQFGYGALHYLIKLKSNYNGARYEGINDLTCELQVRTILQDAWAVVAHHLSYKQESDVPRPLRRKLNALSGLFETADDQFEHIRSLRVQYHKKITKEIENNEFESLNAEIDIDNLSAFLDWKYPDRKNNPDRLPGLINELRTFGYRTLKDVEDLLARTNDAVLAYELNNPPVDTETSANVKYAQIGMVRVALSLVHPDFPTNKAKGRQSKSSPSIEKEKFKHLVKEG
ncbi:GTP pyrophosphokinase family protein [Vibrio sp. HN007]|uniref:GTP pyrophosphokinase n=1 Tax=Vibrio iocasae TaxID=3098914 RepID=UPI0035D51F9A